MQGTPTQPAATPTPAGARSHTPTPATPTNITAVERATDFALQQQNRIADLESQLGANAPGETPVKPVNVRHGCPRCATCSTLLQTVSQLETMLQHKDSDCDALRRSLDDAQRVNALLLEQVEMLQRGLERSISSRPGQQYLANTAGMMAYASPSPAATQHQPGAAAGPVAAVQPSPPRSGSPAQSQIPTSVRMLDPNSDATLRAMADAVLSLQAMWPEKPLKISDSSVSAARQQQQQQQQPVAASAEHSPGTASALSDL